MKGIKHRKPQETHNGRPRLKAFSIVQLEDLITKTSRPKLKDKIRNVIGRKTRLAKKIKSGVDTTPSTV